ncbi:class B sortase [Mogibacterium timidum]|uniref:Sortase, SrtB family n=1 Tax=Mogibacterium timidum ATCC 33093 TaxID=1401079 RepID=X8IWE4_9FIRM|nr:class B sortase [Mogibacterium timidum]EUC53356.1 sortase, SrtB family [Mogibacterium timidum ATCC 33093]
MRSDKYNDVKPNQIVSEEVAVEPKGVAEVDTSESLNRGKKAKKAKSKVKKKKKNRAVDWAFRVIIFCLVCVILISGYKVGTALYNYYHSRSGFKEVAKEAKVDPNQFTGIVDFAALRKQNPDVVGWIYQKDTIINYPIMRGNNNDIYLHTDIKKKYSVSGSIFMDYRNSADFSDFNTIVYGHHMHDGSMFKSLRGYTKENDYYDSHKTFELITPDAKYHLQVFASYITPATSDAYKNSFNSEAEKQAFINYARTNSKISVEGVNISTKDRIVTLSTCAYDFDEARYVVVCKMIPWTKAEVRAGEKLQAKIDKQNGK